MTNYLGYSKPIQFQEAYDGLIVLCEDGSIYRLFYKENKNDVEDIVIKPIFITQGAKEYFDMLKNPNVAKIEIIKSKFTNPSVKSTI